MTRHCFGGDWHHRKMWAGDLLRVYAGRERGRGWFHIGEHRVENGGHTVDALKAILAERPDLSFWVGRREVKVTVYLHDHQPEPGVVRLIMSPTEAHLNIPVLVGPPPPGPGTQ